MESSDAKSIIINRLFNVLKGQAMYVREDTRISDEDRLIQMDVILDLHHFLREYDEATKVLNEYSRKKRGLNNDER